MIREKHVLIVDDNLVGTSRGHVAWAKNLFRAMIEADLGKKWICQATINMGDDEELLSLAHRAGCIGAFIGFESTSSDGLVEVRKKYNVRSERELREGVRRIQRHKITVAGSFIMGLDIDRPGIGRRIAETANRYGIDFLNVLFLTPLPGTDLWKRFEKEGRIALSRFPEEWKYYTLALPVARYKHMGGDEIVSEMHTCTKTFFSMRGILARVARNIWKRQHPVLVLAGNLSYRSNRFLSWNVTRETGRTGEPGRTREIEHRRDLRRAPEVEQPREGSAAVLPPTPMYGNLNVHAMASAVETGGSGTDSKERVGSAGGKTRS